MYKMFVETIEVVIKSKLILSKDDKNISKSIRNASKVSSKISNLEEVI
jgi:hypothetical protein